MTHKLDKLSFKQWMADTFSIFKPDEGFRERPSTLDAKAKAKRKAKMKMQQDSRRRNR